MHRWRDGEINEREEHGPSEHEHDFHEQEHGHVKYIDRELRRRYHTVPGLEDEQIEVKVRVRVK